MKHKSVLDFTMNDIDGAAKPLAAYKGQVCMIINTASECGYTPQYETLEKLYETYKNEGFEILAFPANNFGGQEPGAEPEIKAFCTKNFGVTFPMFAKISVAGADQHPLYKFLTSKDTNAEFAEEINWNFNKFLIGRDGRVVGRFASQTAPLDGKLTAAIEAALESK